MSITNIVLNIAEKELEDRAKKAQNLLKQEVHVKSGALRDSIEIKKKGQREYFIGVNPEKLKSDPRNKEREDYSKAYHEGYREHDVTPKRTKALRWVGSDGKVHFSKRNRIPTYPGDPFVQRAAQRFKRG